MVDQMLIAEQSEENAEKLKNKNDGKSSKPKKIPKPKNLINQSPSEYDSKDDSKIRNSTTLRSIFKDIPLLDIDKNPLVRKSISIDGQVYKSIKHMKDTMSQKSHGRFTFNMVIQSLLQDHVDLQNLRSELTLIKKEMEDTQNYLKEMLKLALTNSKPQVQYIPVTGQALVAPPPPAPPRNPLKKINYTPPNTGNLMKDYVKEIKQLFRGEILLPSAVVDITKVKHKDSIVKELEEDCLIPDIELVSVAKNFKPLIEEESDV
ncbi:MAG: hypothetical protein EU530_05820 [Promethearchaeota archaeon]|nr:MAG: hypothetical protein EU530_05820 [Candidatus Lokiarchaeota archaeon]